jgi:hypothetical protein
MSERITVKRGYALIGRRQLLAWLVWLLLTPLALVAQQKPAPSYPHPAPQIQGRFIDTDGTRSLTLHYVRGSRPHTFFGAIQSTCMLPANSQSRESKPLNLSAIPLGTQMTVYYVHRTVGKQSENVIMAVRFDSVQPGSTLPQGVYIPCFKAAENPAPKP